MRRSRSDGNQAAIVSALRKIGVSVAVTSQVGGGFPDLVCSTALVTTLLEVKIPGEGLTDDQLVFHATWKGPIHIVRSVDDALSLFLLSATAGEVA